MSCCRTIQHYCATTRVRYSSSNPVAHKRAKHIELDYRFIRELVALGKLHTKFIPFKLKVADISTRSLPRQSFEYFRSVLGISQPPCRLRVDVRPT